MTTKRKYERRIRERMIHLTDDDVEEINRLIRGCKWCVYDRLICRLGTLPCVDVIDRGECVVIKDYISKIREEKANEV